MKWQRSQPKYRQRNKIKPLKQVTPDSDPVINRAYYSGIISLLSKAGRAHQQELSLFDVLLRAACKVSSFKEFLLEHREVLHTEEENLLTKTSISEVDKLRVVVATKARYSSEELDFSPMDCFMEVIKSLDPLGEKEREAGSIFSVCMNVVTTCSKCASWGRFLLTLGALRVADFHYFETSAGKEEIEHFNRQSLPAEKVTSVEDQRIYLSAFANRNSDETLQQLLLNSHSTSPIEVKWCQSCLQDTSHRKLTELQSLSSGLIVSLPKGWSKAYAPEILKLQERSIANYQLRAAVVKKVNFTGKGRWLCVDTVTDLEEEFRENPALLFYERSEDVATVNDERERPSTSVPRLLVQKRLYRMRIRRKSLFLNKLPKPNGTETMEAATSVDSLRYSKISTEVEQKEAWISSDLNAELKAALQGLFSIKAFVTCFEKGLFKPRRFPMSQFLIPLKSAYGQYKQQNIEKQTVDQLAELLNKRESTPYQYILQILAEFDSSVKVESHPDLSQMHELTVRIMNENRREKCGVLHDCFSVLMKLRSNYLSDTWTYSRALDIPLSFHILETHNAIENSVSAGNSERTIDLETCIMHLFRSRLDHYSKEEPTHLSQFYYIGSALIIRLFTPNVGEMQGTTICVHRVLNTKKLGIITTSDFRLRAILHYPKNQQNRFFKFEKIDNSDRISYQLNVENMEYLLFFERGAIKYPNKRTKFFATAPLTSLRSDDESEPEGSEKWAKFTYGLRNLGNTCFMNAALNGLYSLRVFRAYFTKSKAFQQQPLLRALVIFCSKHTTEEVPPEVLHQFKSAIPEFSDGRQHCANSYTFKLLMFLDTLKALKSGGSPKGVFESKLRQYRSGKCGDLHDMLSAMTENLFICKRCSCTVRNFSYFRTVDVPIPYRGETEEELTVFYNDNFYPRVAATSYTGTDKSKDVYLRNLFSIRQKLSSSKPRGKPRSIDLFLCFEYMLRVSLMSPDNMMHCDNCGNETQHYKQTFFRRLSTALVIHFQRFDERLGQKLNTLISFPSDLDMSQYCGNDQRQYVLRGVVYHMGSLNFGHYTACISVRKRWYEVDDSRVREVQSLPKENAYMLFYEEKKS